MYETNCSVAKTKEFCIADSAKEIKARMNYRRFWESELGNSIKSRTGSNWLAHSPFRDDRHPSFSVCVEGERAGCWRDFATGDAGDVFSFVMNKHSCGFKEALRYTKQFCI